MATLKYDINLHFQNTSDPIIDSEHYSNWVFRRYCTDYGGDSIPNDEGFDFSRKGFTTHPTWTCMRVDKRGTFISNSTEFDYSTDKEWTLDLRYQIDLDTLTAHKEASEPICAMKWKNGQINILDRHKYTKGSCISVAMGGQKEEIPVSSVYDHNSDICELVVAVNHGLVTIMLNGVKYSDKYFNNPTYRFENIRLGNLNFFNKIEDCVVWFDELVLLNRATYPSELLSKPYHTSFPERVINEEEKKKETYSYSRPSSLDRTMRGLDITRHVDYTITDIERHNAKAKYRFDDIDDDEI